MAFDSRYTRWRALFVPQFWRAQYQAAVYYWPIGRWKTLQPKPWKPKQVAQKRFGNSLLRVPAPPLDLGQGLCCIVPNEAAPGAWAGSGASNWVF